jgi:hypothetical protein
MAEDTGFALTADRVSEVFLDCLFQQGEDTTERVVAEGIVSTVGFHPRRLEGHRKDIEEMLAELPDSFMASKGAGASFLNACLDRNGRQWTGLHQTMEQLFQLGLAIGRVTACVSREMWHLLPGGMPYYTVGCLPRTEGEANGHS